VRDQLLSAFGGNSNVMVDSGCLTSGVLLIRGNWGGRLD
jgi:hypothetical protein